MFAATSKFLRQIMPPVIATLIAAVLIAGFNRAFSTHLTQPRMAGLNTDAGTEPAGARLVAALPAHGAEFVIEIEPVQRQWEKGGMREAAKDATVRIAEAAPRTRRTEPRVAEMRPAEPPVDSRQPEPYLALAAPVPIVVAAPVVAAPPARAEPAWAEPPMVTVPDRARPLPDAHLEAPPAPPQSPVGMIVNTLKPSSLFARARAFGEKIEAAGNEILPSIRP